MNVHEPASAAMLVRDTALGKFLASTLRDKPKNRKRPRRMRRGLTFVRYWRSRKPVSERRRECSIRSFAKGRRVLQITYEGKIRLVEPHAYGIDEEDHELLRAWQLSPLPDDWRTFRVDKAAYIAIADICFSQPRPGYKRNDAAMKKRIYCQL
jgi:hypothetical protein